MTTHDHENPYELNRGIGTPVHPAAKSLDEVVLSLRMLAAKLRIDDDGNELDPLDYTTNRHVMYLAVLGVLSQATEHDSELVQVLAEHESMKRTQDDIHRYRQDAGELQEQLTAVRHDLKLTGARYDTLVRTINDIEMSTKQASGLLSEKVRFLAAIGQKIEAIKMLRDERGLGLHHAKTFVEEWYGSAQGIAMRATVEDFRPGVATFARLDAWMQSLTAAATPPTTAA